jgi:hypothetical protein
MMKCLICGRACVPGAKLCADCSSARKRAFAATVTQPLLEAATARRSGTSLLRPNQSVAATARRTAERVLAKPQVEASPVDAPGASRRVPFMLLIGAGVVLIGAFIAYHRHRAPAVDLPQAGEQPSTAAHTVVSDSPSVVPAQMPPKSVVGTQLPPVDVTVPIAEVPAPKADVGKRGQSKQRVAPVETTPTPPEPAPPSPAVAAAPVVVPPPVSVAPPPDPMEQMRDALSRCATGGIIDRIVCDQRVRREYCDGRWGQVPQCASGVPNDRGG